MAPEQALGSRDVDSRADIYSTACVAYWLLTGQFVFTGETTMQLLLAHAQIDPEPPSSRTEFPVPPDLDELVLDCLAKDPEDRPRSPRDLLARLDTIALECPWTEIQARQWWSMHLPVERSADHADRAVRG
jgi:serine/threonine-protein kinase